MPEPSVRGRTARLVVIVLATFVAVLAAFSLPRMPQPAAYHGLADRRAWLGIPNAADVLSNLPFVVIGVLGLAFLRREDRMAAVFRDRRERAAWRVFFAAVLGGGLLAGLGCPPPR